MLYLKAITSTVVGFVLARLLVAVGFTVIGGTSVGFELVLVQAVLWIAMASVVAFGWTRFEQRGIDGQVTVEPQKVMTPA